MYIYIYIYIWAPEIHPQLSDWEPRDLGGWEGRRGPAERDAPQYSTSWLRKVDPIPSRETRQSLRVRSILTVLRSWLSQLQGCANPSASSG